VAEAPSEADPLEPLAQRLARAEAVDDVTDVTIEFLSQTMTRCMLFLVRSGRALPWRAAGMRTDLPRWASLSFPLTSETMFLLPNGDEFYRGPLPADGSCGRFYESLGIDQPRGDVLVLPAHADDRLVAVLYGDGASDGRVRGSNEDYRRAVQKMAYALTVAQLRRKILST
jgi:hypothetical protein